MSDMPKIGAIRSIAIRAIILAAIDRIMISHTCVSVASGGGPIVYALVSSASP